MSSSPDVRVRLSAEGVKEVVDALRQVQAQADQAARRGTAGLAGFRGVLTDIKSLLPALGLAASATGLLAMGRNALLAADNTGKLADKVGATAEEVSTLQFAAATADVSTDQLQVGLTQLARSLGELDEGTAKQVDAFARLGLAAKDFAGRSTGQAFDIVAQKLGNIRSSSERTKIALDIFGRSGAELIPLLQQLAQDGFEATRQRAEELGLLITGDLANAADAANDSFDIIKLQAQGLATSFVSGLAPSIVDTMGRFSQALEGDGVKKMKEFGREAGRILRVVIETFRLLGRVVGGVFDTIGTTVGGLFASIAAAAQGEFRRAGEILKEATKDTFGGLRETLALAFEDFDRVVAEANREPPEIEVKVKPTADPRAIERTSDREARERREKQLDAEIDRALDDILRKEKAAGEVRRQTQVELLELAGQERDAKIRALNDEIEKRKEILAFAGQLDDIARQQLARRQALGTAQIDLEDAEAQGQRILDSLARARERVQQDVELGVISELQGRERILAIEQQQLVVLQRLAEAARAAAAASGSPELVAQAEAFAAAVRQVEVSVAAASNELLKLKTAGIESFQSGLTDLLSNAEDIKSLEDAFRSLASTVVNAIQRMVSEIIAAQVIKQFFGAVSSAASAAGAAATSGATGGKVVGAAGGGRIRGPGTPTSDSIPAWLSDGEWVIKAASVRKYGDSFMRQVNDGTLHLTPHVADDFKAPHFAEGGPVELRDPGASRQTVDGRIEIGLEAGLIARQLETPEGQEVFLRLAQKSKMALRQTLGS